MAPDRKRKDDVGEILRPFFGREIKRLREESKVSQEELAHEAGMDAGTLRKLEKGKGLLREDYLTGICRFLQIEEGDLMRHVVLAFERSRQESRSADPQDPIFELIRKVREKYDIRARSDREFLDACLELFRFIARRG